MLADHLLLNLDGLSQEAIDAALAEELKDEYVR